MALETLKLYGSRCFQDNVSKQNTNNTYLETLIGSTASGMDYKASVLVATTENITLSGTQTIDGQAVVAGDRVLVKDQSTGSQNGVYLCAASAWTRATDFDSATEVTTGATVWVEKGTANGGTRWTLSTTGAITVGTTSLAFVKTFVLGDAVSTNTASTIVKRDASGDFAAGMITANLTGEVTGNASTATKLATGSIFKSTEQTGTGEAQNIAHGLGATPSLVIVLPTLVGTDGATITEGTHDGTNCVVTATTGAKYFVVAIK